MLYQGALILEGGGFRGVYTAGVLDFFMEKQAMFASIYGISAGACNALSYLSQDKGRYVAIAKRFCNDPRYVGMRQLLTKGSIFNWQFSFYEIPEKYVPFDYDTFYASPMELRVGATDCESGECHWFSNRQQLIVVQGKDFNAVKVFFQRSGKCARVHNIPAGIKVAKDRGISFKDSLFLVQHVRLKTDLFIFQSSHLLTEHKKSRVSPASSIKNHPRSSCSGS